MALARQSRLFRKALRRLVAITGFEVASPYYYYYSGTGGEDGVSTGFGNLSLLYVRKLHTAAGTAYVRRKYNGTNGWAHMLDSGGLWGQYTNSVAGAKYELRPNDVGRLLCFITRITGAPGNVETLVNKVQLPSVAISSYASGGSYILGSDSEGFRSDAVDYVASLDFRGVPTIAQLQTLCDTILALGDVPTAFTGATVTRRHSLPSTLGVTTWVDKGQAPASLADTATGVSGDALTRSEPGFTLREERRSEGRHSIGLTGILATAYLESTGNGIQGGAGGFTLAYAGRAVSADAGGYLVNTYDLVGPSSGYTLYAQTGFVRFYGYGLGDILSLISVSEACNGFLVIITWNGSTLTAWTNGRQVFSGSAGTMTRNASGKMRIGGSTNGSSPSSDFVPGAVAGCDQSVTAVEAATMFDNWQRSGRLALPTGKTNPHEYDFALDVLNASPSGSMPEVFTDRAGTDHLKRVGGLAATSTGLRNFTTADFARTGLAFPGAASGFSGEVMVDLVLADFAGAAWIAGCTNVNSTNGGWSLNTWGSTGTPQLRFLFVDSGQTHVTVAFNISLGMRHIAWSYDGSVARIYVDGVLVATSAAFTYKPTGTGWLAFGVWPGSLTLGYYPLAGGSSMRGMSGGNFIWSAAEIAAASTAGRAAGKPVGVASKHSLRFSLVDDVAEAGGYVPGVLKERVSGTDSMLVLNNGVQPARRVERAFGWSDQPTLIGGRAWSGANYISGTQTGFAHSATLPYWFLVAFIVHAKAGGAYQTILSRATANAQQGNVLYADGTLSGLTYAHGGGGGTAYAPACTIANSDIGRPLVLAYQWNGSVLQAFAKRARLGGDVAATTFSPYALGTFLGRNAENTVNPASDNVSILGVMGGAAVLSLAEYQAAYDAFFADNDLVAVPGKTARLFSVRRAAMLNGGALAAVVDAMGSGETLTISGAPTVSNQYAHAA